MANVSRIRGLKPVKNGDGTPWVGSVERFTALSSGSSIFIGDMVSFPATKVADADGNPVIVPVIDMVSGPVLGVCVGVGFNPNNLNIDGSFKASATTLNRYIYVDVNPRTVYEIQADSAMDFADVGYYATAVSTNTGSVTTGLSGVELDASSIIAASTSTDRLLRIVGFSTAADNEVSNASPKVLVMLNTAQHQRGLTGTFGSAPGA